MVQSPARMMKRWIMMVVMAVMLVGYCGQLVPAYAAVAAAPAASSVVPNCAQFDGITNRIVKCVRTTLDNVSGQFFAQLYPLFARAVTAFITLGVVVFGVMMAAGMVEKIGRDAMVLLIKVAFVAYFVQNTDMLYHWMIDAMDSLASSIFTFATVNHPTAPVCMMNKTVIWERLDCLLDTTFGFENKTSSGAAAIAGAPAGSADAVTNVRISGNGLARGLLAFFSSALFSSVPGFIVGLIGFMFLYTMLFFLVKVLFTFLLAYMAILFLMILGPIFMPLVIFRASKQYFDNWVKLVISFTLQPVIIVAFVSFAVAALDVVVFSGEKSFVRTIAGDAAKANGFNLNDYIELNGGYEIKAKGPQLIAGNNAAGAAGTTQQKGTMGSVTMSDCGLKKALTPGPGGTPGLPGMTDSAVAGMQRCAEGWIVGPNLRVINWANLAKNRKNPPVIATAKANQEKVFMEELYASAILAAVMAFIMNSLMKVVPQIANDLLGSYRQTPNLFGAAGGWKWQSGGGQMAGGMASQMRGVVEQRK